MKDRFITVLAIGMAVGLFAIWAMPKSYTVDEIHRDRCVAVRITETFGGLRTSSEIVYTYLGDGPCQ